MEKQNENKDLDIYNWNYGNVDIKILKDWVDKKIELGFNKVELDISWGYYNDIDELTLKASYKKK
jgi:hypothetical protein